MKIVITEKELVHARSYKPRGDWRDFTESYDSRGGTQLSHVLKTHEELKRLFDLAIRKAQTEVLPLADISIIIPQLLDASEWGGYVGYAWDKDANIRGLRVWWESKNLKEDFHITRVNEQGEDLRVNEKQYLLIEFSDPEKPKRSYQFCG